MLVAAAGTPRSRQAARHSSTQLVTVHTNLCLALVQALVQRGAARPLSLIATWLLPPWLLVAVKEGPLLSAGIPQGSAGGHCNVLCPAGCAGDNGKGSPVCVSFV